MRLRAAQVRFVHDRVSRWYRRHRRELEWRFTNDPYEILISEIMLQQTQVDRVKIKYPLFLRKFPTLHTLAAARTSDVIKAWRGMGYNNRAARLKEMAVTLVRDFRGIIPRDVDLLRELPGIGPYTANALACFAFHARVPVVDVNIDRVLSRLFGPVSNDNGRSAAASICDLARRVLPRNAPAWNQALMDLGATVCKARNPACTACPVRSACRYSRRESVAGRKQAANRYAAARGQHPLLQGKVKAEPTYRGTPRRLWRGKIVQVLRDHGSLSVNKLGATILPGFAERELPWLADLLGKLEHDGLITVQNRRVRLGG